MYAISAALERFRVGESQFLICRGDNLVVRCEVSERSLGPCSDHFSVGIVRHFIL